MIFDSSFVASISLDSANSTLEIFRIDETFQIEPIYAARQSAIDAALFDGSRWYRRLRRWHHLLRHSIFSATADQDMWQMMYATAKRASPNRLGYEKESSIEDTAAVHTCPAQGVATSDESTTMLSAALAAAPDTSEINLSVPMIARALRIDSPQSLLRDLSMFL